MKKFIYFLIISGLFAFELGVKNSDVDLLQNLGLLCEKKGNFCIFAKGSNKNDLLKIKNYIEENANLEVFIINENNNTKTKITNKSIKGNKKEIYGIYSFQFVSTKSLKGAQKVFNKCQFPYCRLEKIGNYYVVRAGLCKKYNECKKYGNYLVMKCNFLPRRILKVKNEDSNFNKK